MMNISMSGNDRPGDDPLGLRGLPGPEPEERRLEQDWAVVKAALEAATERHRQARKIWAGGLAAAASVVLVIALLWMPGQQPSDFQPAPSTVQSPATEPAPAEPGTAELMAMSQGMEQQLRFLSEQVSSMPSEVAVYQVELVDLIGQVDEALSLAPESQALWSQRLGLQIDLVKLYRSQLRRDHLQVASL